LWKHKRVQLARHPSGSINPITTSPHLSPPQGGLFACSVPTLLESVTQ
jgi:hypothetical protein